MSSDSDSGGSGRGITPRCPIPDAAAQQATQSDFGKSVLAVNESGSLCHELYQSPTSSTRSRSYLPSHDSHTSTGDEEDRNEDAKSYPTTVTPPQTCSPEDSGKDDAQISSSVEELTVPVQPADPDASFVIVPTVMSTVREYACEGLLSGYWNILTEDESSDSTTKTMLSPTILDDNIATKDETQVNNIDSTLIDHAGDDDGLTFPMDDVDEDATQNSEDEDQVKYKPSGTFTTLPPFVTESGVRPIHAVSPNTNESEKCGRNTPTPTSRSSSGSNASESSTSSTQSVRAVQSQSTGMHTIALF